MKRIALVLPLLILTGLIVRSQSDNYPTAKRVLLLHHYGREVPAVVLFDQGFEHVLNSVQPGTIEFYRESLENYRFPGENHEQLMLTYLREKYGGRKIDVVVAYTDTTLEFFTRHRDELFPGVPVVYVVSKRPEPGTEPVLSTGVWLGPNIKETLEVALQLQADTQQVFVISGPLNDNRMVEVETRDQLKEFENRVRLNYLIDRPLDEVIARVKNLPMHSIVLCQRQTRGSEGRSVVPRDAVASIAQAANVPVYGTFDVWMGTGIVGGRVASHEEMGKRIAQMALRIAQGAKPAEIPIETSGLIPMFDSRQMRRWGISERALPPGSVVLFRESSFWEEYKWRIIGVVLLVAFEAVLITVLLFERKKRQRANELLSERLRFETLLAKLSADFTDLPGSKVELTIGKWIEDLKTFLKVDNIELINVSANGEGVSNKFSLLQSVREGEASVLLSGSALDRLRQGEIINYARLPAGRRSDEENEQDHNRKSLLAIPIAVNGAKCALMFSTKTHYRQWPNDLLPRLRLIAEIFANALDREHSAEELQKTRTDLAHVGRLTAMGEMAASIAHEVNQPLTAIATYGDACVRLLSAESPNVDKSLEAIRHIISDSMRASEVIKRIRSLVKKSDRNNAALDLNEVIHEVIALTESDLLRHQIQLRLALAPDLVPVFGDRVELQQVVLNMVLNSIEAMQPITGRARELTIASCVNTAGEITVRVSDSGIGLPVDYQQKIFEHFVTSKPDGLGMGLSISRTIIETHGGRLWAEPNSPHGATFLFSLPTKDQRGHE